MDERIIRIALPVHLLREMDAVVTSRIGGYETRAEFVLDAIRERILEISIQAAPEVTPPPQVVATRLDSPNSPYAPGKVPIEEAGAPITVPTIPACRRGFVLSSAENLSDAQTGPLFGLHNRDFPSLWALAFLAERAVEEPVPLEDFLCDVTREAWNLGQHLKVLEAKSGKKCTAIFPTNMEKRKQAEVGFRSFAVGDCRQEGSRFQTFGPLFQWQAIGLLLKPGCSEPLLGITESGWELLEQVHGISLEEPHRRDQAEIFLDHLATNSPGDLMGFVQVVHAVGLGGTSRSALLGHFENNWPRWTANEVSTNSAGYIARAREWGLLEPKQKKSLYQLTEFGSQWLQLMNVKVES